MAIHGSDTQQVVERLKGLLHSTFEGVSHSAEATSRGVGLFAYIVRLRSRLTNAQSLFRESDSVEADELVMREAQVLFLRHRERFHRTDSRADLIRAWTDLFADATEKVYRDKRDAAAYAADARHADDDDRDFYTATRKIAGRG
jgi:hypothetical protein